MDYTINTSTNATVTFLKPVNIFNVSIKDIIEDVKSCGERVKKINNLIDEIREDFNS